MTTHSDTRMAPKTQQSTHSTTHTPTTHGAPCTSDENKPNTPGQDDDTDRIDDVVWLATGVKRLRSRSCVSSFTAEVPKGGGWSSATSRLGLFDLKSVPGSCNLQLLESGVETKRPKLDHLETRELKCFEVSLWEPKRGLYDHNIYFLWKIILA